jgi:hypothetical protein
MSQPIPFADAEHKTKFCTKCKKAMLLKEFYGSGRTTSGNVKYASWCKKCVSVKQSKYYLRTYGPEQLSRTNFRRTKTVRAYLSYLRGHAMQRKGKEVISLDALELLWVIQSGRCALTGWFLTTELGNGVVPTNCSIDRIDSLRGYEVDNVQLVSRAANIAKSNLRTGDFVALCRAVVETHRGT